MDMQTFWREVERIADEFNIGRHPLVQKIAEGKATRDQIKRFAIEHYEMTVRDAGPYIAQGYCNMAKLDPLGAELMAENFVEEAMGEHTHTGGHCELLYEFWEQGLGLPREELAASSASAAARAMNAYFWHLMTNKIRYSGALGILEGGFSQACEKMLEGLQKHYGMKPEALRFFSGHIEADREHAQTGRKLIEKLLTTERDRQEFLTEARCLATLYWKGWDAMM
ncbi:MAG: iron-containing redox enzyme family protein [Bacillota bacterium]|jgi:pyrroloquinoline quinone (PQQ) biosynthesis protein C